MEKFPLLPIHADSPIRLHLSGTVGAVMTGNHNQVHQNINFTLEDIASKYQLLQTSNLVLLESIKDRLANVLHLERRALFAADWTHQWIIVTGQGGVGKSAQVKRLIQHDFKMPASNVLIFRAEQFHKSVLSEVCSEQGVYFEKLLGYFASLPNPIIWIDSFEKLLEVPPESAFKEFVHEVRRYPNLKVIVATRQYALNLLIQKFDLPVTACHIVSILPFSTDELNKVAIQFPKLEPLLQQNALKNLLSIPKHLDLALAALQKSNWIQNFESELDFKRALWDAVVRNERHTADGLPHKRHFSFLNIAVQRAIALKLFIEPEAVDWNAVTCLEADGLLIQGQNQGTYAPAHDILEDWALIRHVEKLEQAVSQAHELFEKLGNAPAIRRAFRLWIAETLMYQADKVFDLIRDVLESTEIEPYWADEILVSVFKSEHSAAFFDDFQAELISQGGIFLNRCLHLMRTACKERQSNPVDLVPIGSGWVSALHFIHQNLAQLTAFRLNICEFLWDLKDFECNEPPIQASMGQLVQFLTGMDKMLKAEKEIIYSFIEQIEAKDEFWRQPAMRLSKQKLLILFRNLLPITKKGIAGLIGRASVKPDGYDLDGFYKDVLDYYIFGINNHLIIKELPDLVIKVLWKLHKFVPEKRNPNSIMYKLNIPSPLEGEKAWGMEKFWHGHHRSIVDEMPVYKLLKYHQNLGLNFFTEFLNYAVDFYLKADYYEKRELEQVAVELNDGQIVQLWGSQFLWDTYRGLSLGYTNSIMIALLKGLEQYLLELAALETQESRTSLSLIFEYLLTKSNNIAPLGVLSSVTMAYPAEVGKWMLPLLRVKSFYHWDLTRQLHEPKVIQIEKIRDSPNVKEDSAYKPLPHRSTHLRGFILIYQLKIGVLNPEIHNILDKFNAQSNIDIVWKKLINEMDGRALKLRREYDEKIGGFILEPDYVPEVKAFMEGNKSEAEAFNITTQYYVWIDKAYKKTELFHLEQWREVYEHYSNQTHIANTPYGIPATLCVIGLRDYNNELTEDEKNWCVHTLMDNIVETAKSNPYYIDGSFNILEEKVILTSFHYLFRAFNHPQDENELILLMIYAIWLKEEEPQHQEEINQYLKNIFWEEHPKIFKKLWLISIQYAQFSRLNPHYRDGYDESTQQVKTKQYDFLQNAIKQDNININFPAIDFKNYESYLLARTFVLSDYGHEDKDYRIFIEKFIVLLRNDLKLKAYSQSNAFFRKGRELNYLALASVQQYLSHLFLNAEINFAQKVLDALIDPLYEPDFQPRQVEDDLLQFSEKVLRNVIYQFDIYISNPANESSGLKTLEHFWRLWAYLFAKIKQHSKYYFVDVLLLDISWRAEVQHWKGLEGKKNIYESFVRRYGIVSPQVVLTVFATIGEKTFLPNGIKQLVSILKEVPTKRSEILMSDRAKILIRRLFYNHLSTIKKDKQLIEAYIWILNNMIDLDSSEAYFFRENVITYKTNVLK